MIGGSFSVAVWAALSVAGAAPDASRPWESATLQQQQDAQVLFDRGVRELFALRFAGAAQDFRKAITLWDLPVFHRNLAAALRGLSNFVEAREQLLVALKYGPEGMDDEAEYKKAQEDLIAVEGELATLVLTCDQEGVKVTLDERKDPFICVREHEERMNPGRHTVLARLDTPGYSRPREEKLDLVKGERLVRELRVPSDEERMVTPFPRWIPPVVLGGGALIAGGGGFLHYQAWLQFRAYDAGIAACTGQPVAGEVYRPCSTERVAPLLSQQVGGEQLQVAAISAYVAGGLLAATGGMLFLLNRSRLPEAPQVALVPMLAPGTAGVTLAAGF